MKKKAFSTIGLVAALLFSSCSRGPEVSPASLASPSEPTPAVTGSPLASAGSSIPASTSAATPAAASQFAATDNSAASTEGYTKYSADYDDLFDTFTTFIAFTKSKAEFDKINDLVYGRMSELDREYDIYNNYDGVNNIKTINDNAGIAPVTVGPDVLALIERGIMAYQATDGTLNMALGPVISLWHDAREQSNGAGPAYIPSTDDLTKANEHTNINDVIVDEAGSTVFLKHKGMSLDVGAIAKGFATNLTIEDAKKAGLISGILNAGGNVVVVGQPMDGRRRWGIGIADPAAAFTGDSDTIDIIYQNSGSVITSGSYERYFTYNGKNYNHIIDPSTLQPADRYTSVTVLLPDSGLADMLTTPLFILPMDQGEAIVKQYGGACMWVTPDDKMYATDGYKKISKTFSNYSAMDP